MTAIQTSYKGINFRSRLEATWAVFFDQVGWPWQYEPVDLAGYIPDFILDLHKPILVEVKPATMDELAQYTAKIDASGWKGEALLVGIGLKKCRHWNFPQIGLLREDFDGTWEWNEQAMFYCACCNRVSMFNTIGMFACRVSGCWDGDHYLVDFNQDGPDGETIIDRMWARAKNTTQWKRGEL